MYVNNKAIPRRKQKNNSILALMLYSTLKQYDSLLILHIFSRRFSSFCSFQLLVSDLFQSILRERLELNEELLFQLALAIKY